MTKQFKLLLILKLEKLVQGGININFVTQFPKDVGKSELDYNYFYLSNK